MLGKVGGWVVIEGLTHTEFWVEYNLPYVNINILISYVNLSGAIFLEPKLKFLLNVIYCATIN